MKYRNLKSHLCVTQTRLRSSRANHLLQPFGGRFRLEIQLKHISNGIETETRTAATDIQQYRIFSLFREFQDPRISKYLGYPKPFTTHVIHRNT